MSMWVKHFIDGTKEIGTDSDIQKKEASWSRGRLENISYVEISNKIVLASLSVPNTEWHHFDHFIVGVDLGKPSSQRVLRVIQAKIKDEHVGNLILPKWYGSYYFSVTIEKLNINKECIPITKDMRDKWITIVFPERGAPKYLITERGRFNEYK